jgi:hypothetical protein
MLLQAGEKRDREKKRVGVNPYMFRDTMLKLLLAETLLYSTFHSSWACE